MSQGFYGFPNILGLLRGTNLKVTGKAGATAGAGLAGGTTSGAPTAPAGPFDLGEVIVDQSGSLWICTTAGTSQSSPGSFTQLAAGFGDPTTTKGDLIVHGSSTTRLGVGSDNQALTADSTQSLGVKWAAAPACEATQSGTYSLTTGTAAMIPLALTTYDQGTATAQHDNVTNNTRLVCRVAGVYAVSGMLTIATNATGVRELFLAVNGGTGNAAWVLYAPTGADQYYMSAAGLWKFAVGDYLELQAQQNSSGNLNAANARLSWARVG